MKRSLIIVSFVFLLLLAAGCSFDMPEGKGKLVISNKVNDYCYINKVWYKEAGTIGWKLCWAESYEGFYPTQANVYLEPGDYAVKIRVMYLDAIPVDYRTEFFNSISIAEDEYTFLEFDGYSLYTPY